MPAYMVVHTHIKHGGRLYSPDQEIEIDEEQAALLGDNVRPVQSGLGLDVQTKPGGKGKKNI